MATGAVLQYTSTNATLGSIDSGVLLLGFASAGGKLHSGAILATCGFCVTIATGCCAGRSSDYDNARFTLSGCAAVSRRWRYSDDFRRDETRHGKMQNAGYTAVDCCGSFIQPETSLAFTPYLRLVAAAIASRALRDYGRPSSSTIASQRIELSLLVVHITTQLQAWLKREAA